MSATSELQTLTSVVSGGASWSFAWPANPDGSYTISAIREESQPFTTPPADDAAAYRRAAYWTAVAARALSDRTLAATSAAYLAKATASMASFEAANRASILTEAAQAILSELPTTAVSDVGEAQRRAIAIHAQGILRSHAAPSALERGSEQDDSWLATLRKEYDRIKAQISKALRAVAIGAGVVSAAVVAGIVWWAWSRRKR